MNPEETTPPPTEGSPVEPSPSLETEQVIELTEKLDELITEMNEEPTPEEIQAQEEQEMNATTYETTTLENAQTEIDLLTQLSEQFTTLQTTLETQHTEQILQYENELKALDQTTWTLVFALTITIGFKIFADNLTKW